MNVVYAGEIPPETITSSIFLAGPSPRDGKGHDWRKDALDILERLSAEIDIEQTVFVPLSRDGSSPSDYLSQVEWEKRWLDSCDVIVFWVPRDLETLPGFTTNVEFGRYVDYGKALLGYPKDAPKNAYLAWLYRDATKREPFHDLEEILKEAMVFTFVDRQGALQRIPANISRHPSFCNWLNKLQAEGNKLVDARVLWNSDLYDKHSHPFGAILWVKIWVTCENRYKENEFVFFRPSLVSVVPYVLDEEDVWNTKIGMVREFRSPSMGSEGKVYELPSGSLKFENYLNNFFDIDKKTAVEELEEETGLKVNEDRLASIGVRQMQSTLAAHQCTVYALELTAEEFEVFENTKEPIVDGDEITYPCNCLLRDLLTSEDVDWSMTGMVMTTILRKQMDRKAVEKQTPGNKVLFALTQNGPMTHAELVQQTKLQKETVSGAILGLLQSQKIKRDGNRLFVEPK
jgi:8-oxo-dGTP pyrophosphatase MutT (NUDIX family)